MDNLIKNTDLLENFTEEKQAKKKKMIIIGIALILIIILVLFLIIFLSSPKKKNFGLIDMSLWEYNEEDKVYYQLQIPYCANPKNTTYQNLGIFIPSNYLKCEKIGKYYKCLKNIEGKIKEYTSETAPIVFIVETPGYSASTPLTKYKNFSQYTNEGIIYMYPGCRGRESGAPSGLIDLKASISYLRFNKDLIPVNMDKIFSFGMSGGGAQICLMRITGDAKEFIPNLKNIGAITNQSNSIFGSQCWCPITNLDKANSAYEWNLASSRTNLSSQLKIFSDKLKSDFVNYINNVKFKDEMGNTLVLNDDIYSGSYYDYVIKKIEESFNNWVSDTQFPYTPQPGPTGFNNNIYIKNQNLNSTIYNNLIEYINYLNELISTIWISYDSINKAKIKDIESFSKAVKKANKYIGAFDSLKKDTGENELFGTNGNKEHFDKTLYEIVKGSEYESSFKSDLEKKDFLGKTKEERINMYNPLYYLMDYYNRIDSSLTPAKCFRINTGIFQSDTSVNTEINLALALFNYIKQSIDVNLEMFWGKKL
jgi:hypothetical protein